MMVSNGKSFNKTDDLGVPPISGNLHCLHQAPPEPPKEAPKFHDEDEAADQWGPSCGRRCWSTVIKMDGLQWNIYENWNYDSLMDIVISLMKNP